MAVRTNQAGVKNKREVRDVRSAMPSTGAKRGKKTVPRDDAAAERRLKSESKMMLGPAAKATDYERTDRGTAVQGRKKAPSQMHVKRKGGPFKKSRLHGG